ncbi:DUF1642 domain-containing protein [Enterococcus casseliflavus]|uniref:DUF1642 domain-containing protein n=1 Tax=Enterococcus casseliflavus TaxID=37734 RepID=UPI001E4685BA|nr:DUF1642 domain-containing protein [Enterococcus casseliflavus]MCD4961226.1 DUF1642 domain-containing protein [Enterococcus casseliflavus]
MEKQVLIEVLEKYQNGYQEQKDGYFKGAYGAYGVALNLVKKLDEQPKVTVPKFAADWIEECKRNATLADCLKGSYKIFIGRKLASEDFKNWVAVNENDELTAKAWIFGYEVDKEPVYEVVFLESDDERYLLMELGEKSYEVVPESENDGYRTQWFTESEIKSIDERYWVFAVPVEEVK